MAIGGNGVNTTQINGMGGAYVPPPPPDAELGVGLTETFSPIGLFVWDSSQVCSFKEIISPGQDVEFDSIRDDTDNNKELEDRLKCITGVNITHACQYGFGDIE